MEILDLYSFKDGRFTFWTAYYGSWANDARVVFRVREDTDPRLRARQKEISNWDRLIPARPNEIKMWIEGHPDYPVLMMEGQSYVGMVGKN
jgi:hypothetical protein